MRKPLRSHTEASCGKSTYWIFSWLVLKRETHVPLVDAIRGKHVFYPVIAHKVVTGFSIFGGQQQMSLMELVLMAISLAMDAFAVSICNGLAMRRVTVKKALTFGIYFGVFQALMPFLGYTLGVQFAGLIEAVDHWIAAILLTIIGGRMVQAGLSKEEERPAGEPELSLRTMLPLAVATSIDALAMGVTLAVIGADIVPAVSLIGLITLILSAVGVYIGHRFGLRFKSKAELLGGATLIIIGIKILLEHLGFLG